MALTTRYISLKAILNNLLDSPMMEGISESQVARFTGECLSLIGASMSYEDGVEQIKIVNHRAELPCNLLYIQQTRKVDPSTGRLDPMRYSSDTFQSAYHEIGSPDFVDKAWNYDFNYSLNNGIIYTNFKDGHIQMSFKAIPVDKEGFPKVPEDEVFQLAVEWYIKERWYTIQWEMGKITDKVLENAKQEKSWYIGKANTRSQLQNIDQAETFRAATTKILDNSIAGLRYFQDFGRQEFIKRGSI